MFGLNLANENKKVSREFKKSIDALRPWLEKRYGRQQATKLIDKVNREYQELLPAVPDLGSGLQVRLFFQPTPRYLAVYRAMLEEGYTVEEAGRAVYAMGAGVIMAIPHLARRLTGWLWFNAFFKRLLRHRATITQHSPDPHGFVIEYIEGISGGFDYGIDYLECASLKYLATNDALPLAPYVCAIDKVASELMGWGLSRQTTLVDGCERCNFRFTRGGPTLVPLPGGLSKSEVATLHNGII